jgi:hypothetical protein
MNYTGTPNGNWGETTSSTSGELQSIYATSNEVEEDTV